MVELIENKQSRLVVVANFCESAICVGNEARLSEAEVFARGPRTKKDTQVPRTNWQGSYASGNITVICGEAIDAH
jgi:hypothetical protein